MIDAIIVRCKREKTSIDLCAEGFTIYLLSFNAMLVKKTLEWQIIKERDENKDKGENVGEFIRERSSPLSLQLPDEICQ